MGSSSSTATAAVSNEPEPCLYQMPSHVAADIREQQQQQQQQQQQHGTQQLRSKRRAPILTKARMQKKTLQEQSQDFLIKANEMIAEIRQVCDVLKFQVISLNRVITEHQSLSSAAAAAATKNLCQSSVPAILAKGHAGGLQVQRRQVMCAIDYLQELEIEIISIIQQVQENCAESITDAYPADDIPKLIATKLPSYADIMDQVQLRLKSEIVIHDDGCLSLVSTNDCGDSVSL